MNRIGLEVCRLRKEVGMTRKQLAKLVGVNEGFITDVEEGRKVVNNDIATKLSKVLRQEIGKLDTLENSEGAYKPEPTRNVKRVVEKPVQEVWNDALSGVLKQVPIYDAKMGKQIDSRQLPVIANKIEGFPKDKLLYIKIENNDMSGFRLVKDDLALAYNTQDLQKDSLYLIEYAGEKKIRQVRSLDHDKLLLVSNNGTLSTETAPKKEVNVLARLIRIEITL
jgi:Predicted transcriptional regulators